MDNLNLDLDLDLDLDIYDKEEEFLEKDKDNNKFYINKKYKRKPLKHLEINKYGYGYHDYNYFIKFQQNKEGEFYALPLQFSGLRGFCKKMTNKAVRKRNKININDIQDKIQDDILDEYDYDCVGSNCEYRRLFDYWYTLF